MITLYEGNMWVEKPRVRSGNDLWDDTKAQVTKEKIDNSVLHQIFNIFI